MCKTALTLKVKTPVTLLLKKNRGKRCLTHRTLLASDRDPVAANLKITPGQNRDR